MSCPGEMINLTCTLNGVFHEWMIRSENISIYINIQGLTSNLFPRSYMYSQLYTLDGFVINDNTMVSFLTFTASTGIINVTCEGDGHNQQFLTAEVTG